MVVLNPLKLNFTRNRKLIAIKNCITKFNASQENIKRIFYLQKINFLLNQCDFDEFLYQWTGDRPDKEGTWQWFLKSYGINPDASFILKNTQFAAALVNALPAEKHATINTDNHGTNQIYLLMQQCAEKLQYNKELNEEEFAQFIKINLQINYIATTDERLKKTLKKHAEILKLAQHKIHAMKGYTEEKSPNYYTEPLSKKQVNNYNFKLKIKQWNKTLVVCVADRSNLEVEQHLQNFPVRKYFVDDASIFMMQMQSKDENDIDYKPIMISKFANQSDLRTYARQLKKEKKSESEIINNLNHFFTQITDFCLLLKEAGIYHPDIKLSNFLAHNQKLRVSDRKTFIRTATALASEIRSTTLYAPPQYSKCLNEEQTEFLPIAEKTQFNMEQFMAYQIGMAMKEFLLLTLFDKIEDEYWEPKTGLTTFLKKPSDAIKNIDLLCRLLTQEEEDKRLPIEKLPLLLPHIQQKNTTFYQTLEKIYPENEEVNKEIAQIKKLLDSINEFNDSTFLTKANIFFNSIAQQTPAAPRLIWFAEQLAAKTYKKSSQKYMLQLANQIEKILLIKDWSKASGKSKFLHFLSFGYYRVPQLTSIHEVEIMDKAVMLAKDWEKASWYKKFLHLISFGYLRIPQITTLKQACVIEKNDPEFESHLPQLEFLPVSSMCDFTPAREKILREYLALSLFTESMSPPNSLKPIENNPPSVSTDTEAKNLNTKISPSEVLSRQKNDAQSARKASSIPSLVIIHNPKADSNPSSVIIHNPKTDSNPSSVIVHNPKTDSNPSSVIIHNPKTDSNPSSVIIHNPKTDSNPSSVITPKTKANSNPSSVIIHTPKSNSNPSSVIIHTPKADSNPSSVIIHNPKADSNPNSVIVNKAKAQSNFIPVVSDNSSYPKTPDILIHSEPEHKPKAPRVKRRQQYTPSKAWFLKVRRVSSLVSAGEINQAAFFSASQNKIEKNQPLQQLNKNVALN